MSLAALKTKLYNICLERIQQQIESAEQAIGATQSSANEETKSSAGDKYETGRAMAQLEIEKLQFQLAEARKLRQTMAQFSPDKESDKIGLGSIVKTNQGSFYISVSLGKLVVDNETCFAISMASPIGQLLAKHAIGATFSFNGRPYEIIEVG